MLYIGLDLGTSSTKGLLVDKQGKILKEASRSYNVIYPKEGWTEQNPQDWYNASYEILKELSNGIENQIGGISVGGQMHGLVILDKDDNVIRPAILWNDGRTEKQTAYLNDVVGKENLCKMTANIAFAGFTAPKILWVRENEPENFKKIAKIMLPKDYLVYRLTGAFSTDYSDASGMLLLDVKNKKWSDEMCNICGIDSSMLPKLYQSYDVVGKVKEEYSLPHAIVTAGAGDNAAAAIGTGTVNDGDCNISLGTSGTVFISSDSFSVDDKNALHSFAHANGKYHLMGCILSAASCNKWWIEDILMSKEYEKAVEGMESTLGNNNVYFLPYLTGERSPHNDVNARGAFIGLTPNTTRAQMSLAVLEGVSFALRDCVEVAKSNGIAVSSTKICGGGAKSPVWKKILANVLSMNVESLKTEQGPAYGAAILAMVGNLEYSSVEEATKAIVKVDSITKPTKELCLKYDNKYAKFKMLYPSLKTFFAKQN